MHPQSSSPTSRLHRTGLRSPLSRKRLGGREVMIFGRVFVASLVLFGGPHPATSKHATEPRLHRLQDLARHVGEYPCTNGLLNAPVLQAAIRKTLGADYGPYREHMSLSGCGAIARRGPYLLMDVSQLHVGGYTSVILGRESDEALFLLWLKSTVAEHDLHVYGSAPLPASALNLFAQAMNASWGHVACFRPQGYSLVVDTAHRANQDTGECLP